MQLTAEQQRFLTLFPPQVWIMTARCPDVQCREIMWVDLIAEEAVCPYGHHWTLAALNAWRAAHPGRQPREIRIPEPLRLYYTTTVPCAACGARLQWRAHDTEGYCRCGAVWTVDQVVDRAAQRVMEEEPRGARIYHKPRKGR